MAGPRMIPQNPNVVIPAIIAKNIIISLILVGNFTSFELMNFITSGFKNVSAKIEITITV